MGTYTVTTTAQQDAGIAAARAAFNARLPPQLDDKGNPIIPVPGTISDDQTYVQMVMSGACDSYAAMYQIPPTS